MTIEYALHELPPVQQLEGVEHALGADPSLRPHVVVRPHPLIVVVRHEQRSVLVAPAAVWNRGRELLAPYAARLTSGDAMLILLGAVDDTDLGSVVNHGVAALLDAKPALHTLVVAIHNAFAMMETRSRAESRAKSLSRYRYELSELVDSARLMTTEREIDKLLGIILEKARYITAADAGSIYVVEGGDPDMRRRVLRFKLTQNDSVHFDWREFTIPISPLSIAGVTALEQKPINIADVYNLPSGTPYAMDPTFDKKIGYRTVSMLCAPLVNKEGSVIGVVQLINKKRDPSARLLSPVDFHNQVVPFDEQSQELLEALASQAGISLENAMLYEEIRRIFEGFVRASVEAIEQRDPTTSGHSRRVAELSVRLARMLVSTDTGPYRGVRFTDQDLRELEYASLLHDFGKIGVRENVLVKAKKLYDSDLQAIEARLRYARRCFEVESYRRKLEAIEQGAPLSALVGMDQELDAQRAFLAKAWVTVLDANEPTVLSEGEFSSIEALTRACYPDDGELRPLLLREEASNLQIARGSLNKAEYQEICSHVAHTFRFLQRIPWGSSFRRIPVVASAHHERLNGTGYPNRLRAEEIPLQSKIMAIADIFDALTAADRPYKKAVPMDRALEILANEARDHHIDAELFRIFREARVWEPGD